MATPKPETVKALNSLRDEMMRLNANFYAGMLTEGEQVKLAEYCNGMVMLTEHIAPGTTRPPQQGMYVTMDELDDDEITYIKKIRSEGQMQGRGWIENINRKAGQSVDRIGKGKIQKEGER